MHLEMSNSVYHHTAALLYCLAIAYIILLQLGYTLNLGNNLCSSWDELLRWLGCQGTSCLVRISLPLGAVLSTDVCQAAAPRNMRKGISGICTIHAVS